MDTRTRDKFPSKGFPIVVDHPDGGLGILGGHSRRLIQEELVDAPVGTFEHLLARGGKR